MTQTHPITPPPELVARLWREASAGRDDAPIGEIFNHGVYIAHRAGADQELEACCAWVDYHCSKDASLDLRDASRPKPSLKEQALHELNDVYNRDKIDDSTYGTICRALEALPE